MVPQKRLLGQKVTVVSLRKQQKLLLPKLTTSLKKTTKNALNLVFYEMLRSATQTVSSKLAASVFE